MPDGTQFCAGCGATAVAAEAIPFPSQPYPRQVYPQQPAPQQVYVNPYAPAPYPYMPPKQTNSCAVAGFILTIIPIFPFIGLVLCFVGLSQCKRTGEGGKGLAVAGIVLQFLAVAAVLLIGLTMLLPMLLAGNFNSIESFFNSLF